MKSKCDITAMIVIPILAALVTVLSHTNLN